MRFIRESLPQSSRKAWAALLALLAIAGFCTASAVAQFGAASVIGYVRDPTNAAVPNAAVTLTNVATGVVTKGVSAPDGRFEFDSVPIGNYRITAEAPGFDTSRTEVFNLSTDARQRVDVAVKPGAVSTTVDVTSAAQLLETETSSRSQVIGTREVENLPLNGRSYSDLVLLAPGTRKSLLENQSASSREGAYNINGQRSEFNEFILDGVENSNYGTSNQGFEDQNISPSPDAVSEFRLETDNYSAEYGRMPGAVINVSTRSGTNEFHGRAWDYIRNTDLNAVGAIEPITNTKPKLIRNQFGGTFGGPIFRDKAFFFVDYEGIRQIFNYQLAAITIPGMAQRLGQFYYDGNTSEPIPLYNPLTATTYEGNVTPGATAFALAVLSDLPAINLAGANGTTLYTSNYSNAPRGFINDDKGDARLDYHFSKVELFARYSEHQANIFDPPTIETLVGGNANSNVNIQNRQIVGGVTWTLSASKLLDVRFAYTRNIGQKTPFLAGHPSLLAQYGITDGFPTDPSQVRALNAQSITGFAQLGAQSSNPQFQDPTIYNPKGIFRLVHGRHSMQFGSEMQLIHTVIDDYNPSYGQDNYASYYATGPSSTFFPACPTSGGVATSLTGGCTVPSTDPHYTQQQQARALADFLFGNRSSYSLTNFTVNNLRQRYFAAFAQDDFKVSPSLTMNIGLRYEIMTPQFEANNRLSNFDPTTNSIIQAGGSTIFQRALVHIPTKNFAPRFGLSYSLDPKTVLRSGYGLVYVQYNREGGENNLTYNAPNVINASINNNNSAYPTPGSLCTTDTQVQTNCFRQTQQGYSSVLTSPAYFNPLNVTTRYIPPHFITGYVQSYFVGIQRQIFGGMLFDVAYVGNKSTHIQVLADYNQASPCLLATVSACTAAGLGYQARRPVSTFGDIEIALNEGTGSYNSLQVKLEKRFGGLYLLNSFTYSRAFDLASGHLETGDGDNSRVNFANPRNDYGPSSYDQPIDNTTSVVWDLPYGHGRHWGQNANAVAQQILGGWQLTAINTTTSGLPININYSSSSSNSTTGMLFTTDLATLRPNHLPGTPLKNPNTAWVKLDKFHPLQNVLPYSSYALPSYALYGNTSAYGNVSRNIMRSFGYNDLDLGLHKQFNLYTQRVKLDFRAEVFNTLNKVNWQAPDTALTDGNGSFGAATAFFPQRQLQFAAKVLF